MKDIDMRVGALIAIAIATIFVIGGIAIFVPKDNAVVLTLLVGFSVTAAGWILNYQQGRATHDLVNSKSEELNDAIRITAYEKGKQDTLDITRESQTHEHDRPSF